MTAEPAGEGVQAAGLTRRTLLRLAGSAGLATAAGCTSASPGRSSGPGHASPDGPPGTSPTGPAPAGSSPAVEAGLAGLSRTLSTPLLRPGSTGYARAVGLYNPRFDRAPRPLAIAACGTPADVVACVRFAGRDGTSLRLRAGGHSYGGWSTGPGLVADVRPMSAVVVDTASRTVRIGAGARLAEVYDALGRRGAAIAAGSCPSVGITGLALGGGVGVLTRAFGLTCDAIRSVQLVTADGVLREVDGRSDPDLLWALRGGGGGSLGAVTALTLQVQPTPTVHTFTLSWSGDHAAQVVSAWQRWMADRSHLLWSTCKVLGTGATGDLRALVAGTWLGAASALDPELAALRRAVGAPTRSRSTRTLDYRRTMQLEAGCLNQDVQQCLSTALGRAERLPFAATSAILRSALPEAGVATAVAGAARALQVPGLVEGGISFDALGGKVDEVAPTATAFAHRGALATIQYTATWSRRAADPAPYDAFVRGQRADLLGWTGPAAYVNYADPSLRDYSSAYWGANRGRLAAIKNAHDPHDLFSFPQAIPSR